MFQGVNLIRELLHICLNRDGAVHRSQTLCWCRRADPVTCTVPNSPPSFSGQQQGGKDKRGKTKQLQAVHAKGQKEHPCHFFFAVQPIHLISSAMDWKISSWYSYSSWSPCGSRDLLWHMVPTPRRFTEMHTS